MVFTQILELDVLRLRKTLRNHFVAILALAVLEMPCVSFAESPVSLVKFEAESGALGSDFVVINTNNPIKARGASEWTKSEVEK
jgi:hypothetical protein